MRGAIRGFLIGALLPFAFASLDSLIAGRSTVWFYYSGWLLTFPCAIAGAIICAAWDGFMDEERGRD